MTMISCKLCGGEVVQKSRNRLILVGIVLIAFVGVGFLWWPLFLTGVITLLTGAYLLVWAFVGQGRWCRGCKRFDGV